jgi:tetratricopeptide (TPR) repeat protein
LKLGIDIDDSVEFNALITEAYEMFMKKDFSGAIENLKKAEKFYDAEPEVREAKIALASILNFQGYCYLGLNDLENAREVFEKALVLNPESSQACAGLGEIFYLLEQDENAKIMYEWALRNEPGNQFAVAGLEKVGNATETENPEVTAQTEEDEEIMTAAEKIENLIEEAYNDFAIKEFREAIAKLEEAEKLVNETFEEQDKTFALSSINNFLGFNYLGIQENEKAKEHFEKSINYNSETAQGYAGLGTVNYLLGNDEEAKRLLEKSLKINPQNKYALGELIKVNRALGLEDDDNENV